MATDLAQYPIMTLFSRRLVNRFRVHPARRASRVQSNESRDSKGRVRVRSQFDKERKGNVMGRLIVRFQKRHVYIRGKPEFLSSELGRRSPFVGRKCGVLRHFGLRGNSHFGRKAENNKAKA